MTPTTAHLKIIFAGSVGAGKSCSIQTVSDVPVVSTEENASDETKLRKDLTTVAMDYGQMNLEDGTIIHLYGAPGQGRFDFMWEILAQGSLGVVLLIDDTSKAPMEELEAYLKAFSEQLNSRKLVIGITRSDLNAEHNIKAYREFVARHDRTTPVFSMDAREPDQVKTLIRALLFRIDPWLS
jgi:signal recognition particle receptor subunit beta